MKQTCASCYKKFEAWDVVLLKPRYQEYTNKIIASLICRDCAKEEIEKGIIKEDNSIELMKGFNKVKVIMGVYKGNLNKICRFEKPKCAWCRDKDHCGEYYRAEQAGKVEKANKPIYPKWVTPQILEKWNVEIVARGVTRLTVKKGDA